MDDLLRDVLERVFSAKEMPVVEEMLEEVNTHIKDNASRRRKIDSIILEALE